MRIKLEVLSERMSILATTFSTDNYDTDTCIATHSGKATSLRYTLLGTSIIISFSPVKIRQGDTLYIIPENKRTGFIKLTSEE